MTAFSTADSRWMMRALRLAARGYTTPNPMVGCVLVKQGAVVGEGYHRCAGMPHAEVEAIRAAGNLARGSTAYVTLEPCCHTGRTGPCTYALLKAGVLRVIAAVQDPDPRVGGAGFAEMRRAGLQVEIGLLASRATLLNEAYFHYQLNALPFIALKAAVSIDGKTASRTGDSRWITGEPARRFAHKLRGRSGAVLCGVGTVITDDPQLTCRLPGVPRQPLRVVLDTHLRTPVGSKVVVDPSAETVIVTATTNVGLRSRYPERPGLSFLTVGLDNAGRVDVTRLVTELGKRGISSLLVEGGGTVHASFLRAGQVHHLLWFIAPSIIGGTNAPTSVEGPGVDRVDEGYSFERPTIRRLGQDILLETRPRRS